MNEVSPDTPESRKSQFWPALLLLALAIIFVHPIFMSWSKLGIHDWSLFYVSCGFERRALLDFHQAPLWNPYTFGGTPHFGHTHQMTLSPFFLPVLALGEVTGLKISFILYLWAGMGGMWLLCRRMGIKKISSYFAAIIWGLNGFMALRFVVGHINHFPLLLLPWVVLFFLEGIKRPLRAIWAGAALALMFLSGGDYPFILSIIFLVVFAVCLAARGPLRVFGALILALVAAALFSAVKLIPTIEFLRQSVPIHPERSGVELDAALRALWTRNLSLQVDYTKAGYGEWEYGAYMGLFGLPLLFFLGGAIFSAKEIWRSRQKTASIFFPGTSFFLAGIIFLLMSTGHKGPFPIFKAVAWLPLLKNLHVPFRFMALFIFTAGLLGSYFLSFVERRGLKAWLIAAITIFLAVDFIMMANPIFKEAFVVAESGEDKRVAVLELPREARLWKQDLDGLKLAEGSGLSTSPIQHIRLNWLRKNPHFRRDAYWLIQPETLNAYLNLLQGKGTLDFYDPQHLAPFALAPDDAGYRGETFLAQERGFAQIVKFSPDRTLIQFRTDEPANLILNQNYFPGWRVKGHVRGKVQPYNGLISVEVAPGEGKAVFQFLPTSFFIGLSISLLALGVSCYIGFLRLRA